MHSRKLARIIALVLVFVLVITFIISAVSYIALAAPIDEEIARIDAENEELAQKITEVESQINSFEFDTLSILEKKTMLDKLVILTETEIFNLNAKIDTYDILAVELQDDLKLSQNNEIRHLDSVTNRIRAYEENGFFAYISIVFEAQDFSEFLGRVDLLRTVIAYDNYVFDAYSASKDRTAEIELRIESIESDKDGIREIIAEKEAVRDKRVAAAEEFITDAANSKSGYELIYAEIDAGLPEFESEIANKKAEQIRLSPQIQPGTGAFIWPLTSSSNVALSFGTKLDPTYNMYRIHNGIDITAEYGSDVFACDGGMVTATGYDPIYGNYVVINHGNGYETVYAQLSIVVVEEGQQLLQGTLIACVGSTGFALEPHLHFEIRKDGTCTNPLSYFTGYSIQ